MTGNLTTNYYRHVLLQEFERRKGKNPRYSLRSFARDLDLDQATLSRVFAQKSSLSLPSGKKICRLLRLSKQESSLFLESIADSRKVQSLQNETPQHALPSEVGMVEHDTFAVISNLYHYAILELVQTDHFTPDMKKMAKSLGLTVVEVEQAISRLLRVGLLKREGGKLIKTQNYITTKDKDKTSEALRHHQRQILRNALYRLDAEPIEKRIMSGMTIPIDPDQLPVARKLINDFGEKMAEVMSAGKRTSVYQLHVSFCSLLAAEKAATEKKPL